MRQLRVHLIFQVTKRGPVTQALRGEETVSACPYAAALSSPCEVSRVCIMDVQYLVGLLLLCSLAVHLPDLTGVFGSLQDY